MFASRGLSGLSGDVVSTGAPAIFTLATNKTIDFTDSADVIGSVTSEVSQYGEVTAAINPNFSGQYIFTIVPDVAMSEDQWSGILVQAMVDAGYPSASYVSMLGGAVVPAETEAMAEAGTTDTGFEVTSPTPTVQAPVQTIAKPTKVPTVSAAAASPASTASSTSVADTISSYSPYIIAGAVAIGLVVGGVMYFKKKKGGK